VPVLIFEWRIGRDELYYRLLEERFRDDFGDRDARVWFDRITREAWEARPEPKADLAEFRDRVDLRLGLELDSASDLRSAFAQQQENFILACKEFVRAFPDSRYAPNTLYLQGQALDARIDVEAFQDKKLLRTYFDFPVSSPRAETVWKKVVHNAPESSISAVGRYKLAVIEARAGRIARAIEWLDELIARRGGKTPQEDGRTPARGNSVTTVLAAAPPDASLNILVENVYFEGQCLLALLLHNGDDPHYGVRPLCGTPPDEPRRPGLLQLDAHAAQYADNLRALLRAYPRSLAADNISLRLAMTGQTADDRVYHLQACVNDYPDGDARAEALYQLGVACLEAGQESRGRETLAQVAREFGDSMWAEPASKRLRALPPLESAP
jgi:TolA-binding protein